MRTLGRCSQTWPSTFADHMRRIHFATHTEAYDAIARHIDGFYSPIRRPSTLGNLSPINFERVSMSGQAA